MLINIQSDQESTTSGVDVAQMRFDTTKQAKLFHMLSSSLYSDKPASIIRELCSNCHDSHIMAGKTNVPFVLTAPTFEHPFLSVKDSGVGLSAEEALATILCYLGSNKDTSDEFIGGWGIGAKSPFSYAKNYQVIVTKNGIRAEFSCWKDEHGLPSRALIDNSPTNEPNGVEVIVPIEVEDIRRFCSAISSYMEWTNYNVKAFNGEQEIRRRAPIESLTRSDDYTIELFATGTGEIRLVYGGQSYSMEACVDDKYDYSGDWKQLQETSSDNYDIAIIIHKPGSIDFNMNREELEQTDKSRAFVREVIGYLSAEGNKHAKMYADELATWGVDMKGRAVAGDALPTLKDVNDMITAALDKGNNADRFFGKAFRVFDQKLRYDLKGVCNKITTLSGVQRAHSLNLVIAELHTQIEFVYGRIVGLTNSQRRAALQGSKAKEVIYVKGETREEFDAFIAANADFSALDMSKFKVTFFDVPKKAAGYSSRPSKPMPPRIYDAVVKAFVPYNTYQTYLMVTEAEKASPPQVLKLIQGAAWTSPPILFVPTADFKRKKDKPANVLTLEYYIEKSLPDANAKLASAAGIFGRRRVKMSNLVRALQFHAGSSNLPASLEAEAEAAYDAMRDLVGLAENLQESMGLEAFVAAGKGKTRKHIMTAHALCREADRVAAVTRYMRVEKMRNDYKTSAVVKSIIESAGLTKYFA